MCFLVSLSFRTVGLFGSLGFHRNFGGYEFVGSFILKCHLNRRIGLAKIPWTTLLCSQFVTLSIWAHTSCYFLWVVQFFIYPALLSLNSLFLHSSHICFLYIIQRHHLPNSLAWDPVRIHSPWHLNPMFSYLYISWFWRSIEALDICMIVIVVCIFAGKLWKCNVTS
jgi:hypothetical protein